MNEFELPLKNREEIADGTMVFHFDTTGIDFSFRAGQYTSITLINPPHTDAEGDKRDFSIANSPNQKGEFIITTRMRNTAFKNSLKEVPLGTKVKVMAPMGSFTLHKDVTKPAVFVAGGIGITPMKSMIEWSLEEKIPREMILLYSNNTPESTTFLKEFEEFATKYPNFKFIPTITAETNTPWKYEKGRLSDAMIQKYIKDIHAPIYYVAGPPPMVAGLWQTLVKMGISEDNIKSEDFAGY